ncbi:TetR/AcrR family transcriptional regulator [Streptomyces olivaceus]|uniref:TetR/AcrR family transcriptional regulator n=1 Tax=Streptomyces olivaceus TaxID=47716 RepID=A0ABS7W9Y9_STROV|nr:helix-turn-helix domain-containing protein [Streptomyces olivaceus]MBZ6081150.1 TetR/AcrR family transcriptional regulator [Streptomyces olivaceus]MBZ6089441.1 TetR/AcrR family transcriptional regulator [Streptomyces olivaceus]MBZ6097579.1 TetR/AcrR family transcriptional regulator [Streptomyces olivaceus]MBZ6117983.1 TetR/AcrR family transcriptional regulator [Streptomyces olivaceus]MBZ6154764.1 TetR/AcrR family transcriptional regulator [Streptomyces olivaceus]
MATRSSRPRRRNQVLSRQQIVATALELLDTGGEGALTVRALTERLATGSGAIYYQVGTRDELLDAVTEEVVTGALTAGPDGGATTPGDEVRRVALALFDAITEHPWLATRLTLQLVRNPVGPVTVEIFERIGRQMGALGVPRGSWFDAASTLVHYILGAISQNARTDADTPGIEPEREEFFGAAATAWQELDPEEYPFMHAVVGQMSRHDDREQFLTGIAIVLDGLAGLSRPGGTAG